MKTIIVRLLDRRTGVIGQEVVVTAKDGATTDEMVAFAIQCIINEFLDVEVSIPVEVENVGMLHTAKEAVIYDN